MVFCLAVSLVPMMAAGQDAAKRFDTELRLMTWGDVSEQPAPDGGSRTFGDFLVRRARVVVQGRLSDRITLAFQVGQDNIGAKVLTPDGGISIKDAYANIRLANAFQVAAGQFKVPFLRSNLESGFNQLLVDRGSLPGFRPAREGSRDVGAMAWGNIGFSQYRVAVFDGSDQEATSEPAGPRVTARLAHNWFSRETGMGYSGTSIGATRTLQLAVQTDVQQSRTDPRDDAAFRAFARDYRAYALEAFIEQPLARWAVTGEGAWLRRNDDYEAAATPTRELRGYYALGGLLLPPLGRDQRLQVAVRREEWTTDRGTGDAESIRATVGGTLYAKGHGRKFQADYTVKREAPEVPNNEFRASLVLVF
jgi:hypothetical protein